MAEYVFDMWPAAEGFVAAVSMLAGFVHWSNRKANGLYFDAVPSPPHPNPPRTAAPEPVTQRPQPERAAVVPQALAYASEPSLEQLLDLPRQVFRQRSHPVLCQVAGWAGALDFGPNGLAETTFLTMREEGWRLMPERPTKALAKCLGRLGFGMEPDIRFPRYLVESAQTMVVFRIPEESADAPVQESYQDALAVAHLAGLWMHAGQPVSPQLEYGLVEWAAAEFDLSRIEELRLYAYLHWLLSEPRELMRLKRPLDALGLERRAELGALLGTLPRALDQTTALKRVYRWMDLPLAARAAAAATGAPSLTPQGVGS